MSFSRQELKLIVNALNSHAGIKALCGNPKGDEAEKEARELQTKVIHELMKQG